MKIKIMALLGGAIFGVSALADVPFEEEGPELKLAYFEPSESDQAGSLGIKYAGSYSKTLADSLSAQTERPVPPGDWVSNYNFEIFARGNAPFKKDFFIENFLETGLDMKWNIWKLGVSDVAVPESAEIDQDSLYGFLGANYQFESDSRFDNRQHAYGLKFFGGYKSPDGSLARYANPLEWGPSLIKSILYAAKIDESKVMSAKPFDEAYFPRILLAVEQVDPQSDQERKAVDASLKKYERLRVNVSYSTTLLKYNDKVYRLSFVWRHFREIAPSRDIEQVNLDRYTFRSFALSTPSNIFISYSSGKLPFDRQSENLFKVGYDFHF